MGATEMGVQLTVALGAAAPGLAHRAPADEVSVIAAEDQREFFFGADALAAQAVYSVFEGGLSARVLLEHFGSDGSQESPDGGRLRPRGLEFGVAPQDVGDEEIGPPALHERGEQGLGLRFDGLEPVPVHVELAGDALDLVQQDGQAGRGEGDTEGGGGGRLDVVRLVEDDEVVVRQQFSVRLAAAADGQVAEEEGVVDQEQIRLLCAPRRIR